MEKVINILIVEDGKLIVDTIKTILFKYKLTIQALPDINFNVTEVVSFKSAYKQKDKAFDLVLLDNNLPLHDNVEKNQWGFTETSPCGYSLIPAFKKHSKFIAVTSSENAKHDPVEFTWDKAGVNSWDDLLKILIFVAKELKLI